MCYFPSCFSTFTYSEAIPFVHLLFRSFYAAYVYIKKNLKKKSKRTGINKLPSSLLGPSLASDFPSPPLFFCWPCLLVYFYRFSFFPSFLFTFYFIYFFFLGGCCCSYLKEANVLQGRFRQRPLAFIRRRQIVAIVSNVTLARNLLSPSSHGA